MAKKIKQPSPRTGPALRQFSAFEMDERARERAARALREYAASQRAEPDALGGKPRTKAEKRRAERQEAHIGHPTLVDPTNAGGAESRQEAHRRAKGAIG
jgi:hypothetical protein